MPIKQASEGTHPGFENQSRRHQKSQNWGISGPTKMTDVLQKLKKTKNKKKNQLFADQSEVSALPCRVGKTEVSLMMLNHLPCREPLVNLNGVSVYHP